MSCENPACFADRPRFADWTPWMVAASAMYILSMHVGHEVLAACVVRIRRTLHAWP